MVVDMTIMKTFPVLTLFETICIESDEYKDDDNDADGKLKLR